MGLSFALFSVYGGGVYGTSEESQSGEITPIMSATSPIVPEETTVTEPAATERVSSSDEIVSGAEEVTIGASDPESSGEETLNSDALKAKMEEISSDIPRPDLSSDIDEVPTTLDDLFDAIAEVISDGTHYALKILEKHPNFVTEASKDGQLTPLHIAAFSGNDEIVRYLIAHGALLDALDKKEGTPLHAAIRKGHLTTVEIFLEAGADVKRHTSEGTVVDLAKAHEQLHLLPILKTALGQEESAASEEKIEAEEEKQDATPEVEAPAAVVLELNFGADKKPIERTTSISRPSRPATLPEGELIRPQTPFLDFSQQSDATENREPVMLNFLGSPIVETVRERLENLSKFLENDPLENPQPAAETASTEEKSTPQADTTAPSEENAPHLASMSDILKLSMHFREQELKNAKDEQRKLDEKEIEQLTREKAQLQKACAQQAQNMEQLTKRIKALEAQSTQVTLAYNDNRVYQKNILPRDDSQNNRRQRGQYHSRNRY